MSWLVTLLTMIFVSSLAYGGQIISCEGQQGQSLVEMDLSDQGNYFVYSWDGAEDEDVEIQKLSKVSENSSKVNYATTSGRYSFQMSVPQEVIEQDAQNFYITVKSNIGDFASEGEKFDNCTSETTATACSDNDWDRLISDPLTNQDGMKLEVLEPISYWDLPQELKPSFVVAMLEVQDRTFPGTDYSASIDGIYAIYRSASDQTVVAYALNAYGSGEPDYNEQMVFGFDLEGNRVFEQILEW